MVLEDAHGRTIAENAATALLLGQSPETLRPLAAAYGLLLAALVLGVGGGGATWLWLRAAAARDDAQRARDQLLGALGRELRCEERLRLGHEAGG